MENNKELTCEEKKLILVKFVKTLNTVDFYAEVSCMGFNFADSDADEFDSEYFNVSLSSNQKENKSCVSIRVDFNEMKYWITADDGYYIIGSKRSLENDYSQKLLMLADALINEE